MVDLAIGSQAPNFKITEPSIKLNSSYTASYLNMVNEKYKRCSQNS